MLEHPAGFSQLDPPDNAASFGMRCSVHTPTARVEQLRTGLRDQPIIKDDLASADVLNCLVGGRNVV